MTESPIDTYGHRIHLREGLAFVTTQDSTDHAVGTLAIVTPRCVVMMRINHELPHSVIDAARRLLATNGLGNG